MKLLFNLVSLVVYISVCALLLFAWKADGLNGVGKIFSVLIILPCAVWTVVWIARGLYWVVVILLASVFMGIESSARQILKIVWGR